MCGKNPKRVSVLYLIKSVCSTRLRGSYIYGIPEMSCQVNVL